MMKNFSIKIGQFVRKYPIITVITGLILIGIFQVDEDLNDKSEAVSIKKEVNSYKQFTNKSDIEFVAKTLDYFEDKLRNSFWVEFAPTTRRGSKGPTSINFSLDKYEEFVTSKGLKRIDGGTLREYFGNINGFTLYITENRELTNDGYVDIWTLRMEKNIDGEIYKLEREFRVSYPKK